MNVVKLHPTTWLPNGLVEGYSSLIWTERFRVVGDFVMETPLVEKTMNLLPEGTLLSLLESEDIMIVEDRQIKETTKGPVLTVTGRSIMSLLQIRSPSDNRYVTKDAYDHDIPDYLLTTQSSFSWRIAMLLITKGLGGTNELVNSNPVGFPPERNNPNYSQDVINPDLWSWCGDLVDPEYVRPPDGSYAESILWWNHVVYADEPTIYDHVVKYLEDRNRGLVFTKPRRLYSETCYFTVKDPGDHTINSTSLTPVVFDYSAGHISKVSYLWSNKDYRNIAYVLSPLGFKIVAAPGVSVNISGLARRVLMVDANDLEDAYDGYENNDQQLVRRGLDELNKHNQTAIIDAEISEQNPHSFGYNVRYGVADYSMGDYVTVKGEYGLSQTMQVTEYIRMEDAVGNSKEYPTLTAVDYLI